MQDLALKIYKFSRDYIPDADPESRCFAHGSTKIMHSKFTMHPTCHFRIIFFWGGVTDPFPDAAP